MQATRSSPRLWPALASLLLVAPTLAAAERPKQAACAEEPPLPTSAGVSLITSGEAVISQLKGLQDPFAELGDDGEASLLMVDEDEEPLATAAAAATADVVVEEVQPKVVPTTDAKSSRLFVVTVGDSSYYMILTGLVCVFYLIAGRLFSVMDSALSKGFHKPGREGEGARRLPAAAEQTQAEPTCARSYGSVEEEDEYGCTALHGAADRGAASEVRELLERGADVDKREAWDETPLHFAARAGSVEACELLLEAGAELNPVNESGCTPLMVAAHAGKESVCKVLLERGGHVAGLPDSEVPPLLGALMVSRIFAEVAAAAPAGEMLANEERAEDSSAEDMLSEEVWAEEQEEQEEDDDEEELLEE